MGKCRRNDGYPKDYYYDCGVDGKQWLTAGDYRKNGESYYDAYIRLRNKYWDEMEAFMGRVQEMHAEIFGRLLIEDLRKRPDYQESEYGTGTADKAILNEWYNARMRMALKGRGGLWSGKWVACPIKFDQSDCDTTAYNAMAGILGFARFGWRFIESAYEKKLAEKEERSRIEAAERRSQEKKEIQSRIIREQSAEWVSDAEEKEHQNLLESVASRRGELVAKTALTLVVVGCIGVGGYVGYRYAARNWW